MSPKCVLMFLCLAAQLTSQENRGVYFEKKEYTQKSLPTFSESKDFLPHPVIEGNPDLIDLYWKAWEIAFTKLRQPQDGSTLVSNYIDEAFSNNIFQWDTALMILFSRYGHHVFPAIQSLDNFYANQHENGFICREIREEDGSDFYYFLDFFGTKNLINPPIFTWAETESYKISGDKSRYTMVIPVLEKYAEWLEKYRCKSNTKHELYWNTGLGSGMDNTPRHGSGWVDMSSQMVMLYRDLAEMCDEIGKSKKADKFRNTAASISDRINQFMWNETDGLYYDVDDNGKQVPWKTIACFWPMLAGVCSEHQAEELIRHITDPNSFWRTIPFPSHAADEEGYCPMGDYWRGGVWAPTNHMVIKGVEQYGYDKIASTASEKYLDGLSKVYQQTGTLWENYAPDSVAPGNKSRPDFVGFTGCGPIALLLENVIGIRPNAPDNTITWYLHRDDKHGINNLRFGDITVSLICEPALSGNNKRLIQIETDMPFTLIVRTEEGENQFEVSAGQTKIEVP
ncbi:hypothetical protein HQ585_19240 [candidate division KSB1 bacterium]|nr:hypothetical protein [candidate division KSB1 bacterium]